MHGDTSVSLLQAIRDGEKDIARRILLARNYKNIDKQSSRKDGTPLFWSCCLGYVDIVHLLLLNGADVNRCTGWGATPLHACVDHNHVDIISLLVRFGADVNQQTKYGDTPCHLACYRGYVTCVKRLLEEGADLDKRNSKRLTPVQETYIRGHYDLYKYLVNIQHIGKRSHTKAKSIDDDASITQYSSSPYISVKNDDSDRYDDSVRYDAIRYDSGKTSVDTSAKIARPPSSLYYIPPPILPPRSENIPIHPDILSLSSSGSLSVRSETDSYTDSSLYSSYVHSTRAPFNSMCEEKKINTQVVVPRFNVMRSSSVRSYDSDSDVSSDFSQLSLNDLSTDTNLSLNDFSSDFSTDTTLSLNDLSADTTSLSSHHVSSSNPLMLRNI